MRTWLKNRMVHRCAIERDVGTARSDIGEIVEVGSAVATAQQCRFIEKRERFASESAGLVMGHVTLLLVPPGTDIEANDTVHTITDSNGTAIAAGTYAVNGVVTRRNVQGDISHLSADLERIEIV